MSKDRILIISHGHPDITKGGGEIAAYQLYEELRNQGREAWFLAAHRDLAAYHGGTSFSIINQREILFYSRMNEFFTFSNSDQNAIWKDFGEFLDRIKPTIVHFHHYIHLGIEMIREVRNYEARSGQKLRIILTLHEYCAICNNSGQMIKRNTNKLCYKATPADCAKCFPEFKATDFFLRERYIKSFLHLVDQFISPSHFLKQRYVDWGIEADKITVLENGQSPAEKLPPRRLAEGENRLRFAYFGQITPFKGLDVLLGALEHLPKEIRKEISIQIHGTPLEWVPENFRNKVQPLIDKYPKQVRYFGPYEQNEMPGLMQGVDWVVMPSTWWENSPLVIQEAFKYGRPMIVSNIGGMAEKVQDRVNGLHFRVGHSEDLARCMEEAVRTEGLWERLAENIPSVLSVEAWANLHLSIYEIHKG
jgi:glycosyltransferase involved in cell wall biosynthesis